jgi:hypothetical protein
VPQNVIPFQEKNQYLEQDGRMALAKQLIEDGRI